MGFWFDWLRGFDESDARSLERKIEEGKHLPPGSVVYLTNREWKAMKYFNALVTRSNGKTEAV